MSIADVFAVPEQLCGPVTVMWSSLVTVALNPLNGALNVSAHPFCVTVRVCPTSEASQCDVTFQLPATLGHDPSPPPLPDDELLHAALHATRTSTTAKRDRTIVPGYAPRGTERTCSLGPRAT
jgi:hypothetical protein